MLNICQFIIFVNVFTYFKIEIIYLIHLDLLRFKNVCYHSLLQGLSIAITGPSLLSSHTELKSTFMPDSNVHIARTAGYIIGAFIGTCNKLSSNA